MDNYLEMVQKTLGESPRGNRTSTLTRSRFGWNLEFDLEDGFPLVTTKPVKIESIIGELVGFCLGRTNATDFAQLGTKVWEDNANGAGTPDAPNAWLTNPHRKGTGDLGPIYGAQWRNWESIKLVNIGGPDNEAGWSKVYAYFLDGYIRVGEFPNSTGKVAVLKKNIDQLQNLIDGLKKDPRGRRHIVSAWNPGVAGEIALPPCHVFFQCYVNERNELDLQMYQRSADVYLGVPFNIASYAALVHVLARLTGLIPGRLLMTFGDVHIYENAVAMCEVQLDRKPHRLPQLKVRELKSIDDLTPQHFELVGYNPHDPMPERVRMVV